jgi:hypothetical protein
MRGSGAYFLGVRSKREAKGKRKGSEREVAEKTYTVEKGEHLRCLGSEREALRFPFASPGKRFLTGEALQL